MESKSVDWNEAPLARWMGGITKPGTKSTYKGGFKLYLQYTGLTASRLIDEAIEDQRRDPRERTDAVKRRLIGFYNWLVEEAPRKRGGRYGGKVVDKGLSSKIAHTYVNAVRSFYGTYDVYVKLKGRSKLPRAKVENKRMIVTNMDVKKLVDHARAPRDRAIILTMFQGGMDVSTLCSLKYGDVAEGLAKNEHPLKLDLFRPKTGIEYYTFLGHDAVEAIKAYLDDAKGRGVVFDERTPLFLKESIKAKQCEGIESNLVQNMLRDVAIKSGFIDEKNNGKAFNPLSPHALRESFGSIMINHGVPDTIVDFWLGHEIGEMADAYKRARLEELTRIYSEREPFISTTSGGELEEKLRAEIDEKNRQLQTLVNGLATSNVELKEENRELKKRMARVELEITELKKVLQEPKS